MNQAQSFEGMAAITGTQDFSVVSGTEPELIKGEYVTENYFDLLGVSAFKGRVFVEEDGKTETSPKTFAVRWMPRRSGACNCCG